MVLSLPVQAQTDSRNRTKETIIQDGLASLPAKNLKAMNQVVSEMAATGQEGMQMLTGMLVPASQGKNAVFEYAIDGIVNYVSEPKNAALKDDVLKGLKAGLDKCTDDAHRAFLITEIQKIASSKDIPYLEKFKNDKYLSGYAERAITSINGLKYDNSPVGNTQELLKSKKAYLRCAGLRQLLFEDKANAVKNIQKALKDPCIQYRNTALDNAEKAAGEGIFATIAAKKYANNVQTDVVRWLGNNHRSQQIDVVVNAIKQHKDSTLCRAGIEAACKIGGDKALNALVAELGTGYSPEANKALLSFNGNVNTQVINALASNDKTVQKNALKIVSERHMHSAYAKVLELTTSQDASIKESAYKAMVGVATADNFNEVCNLMESADNTYAASLQQAAKNAIKPLAADEQYSMVAKRMEKTSKASLYYPLLAQVANTQSIKKLTEEYNKATDKTAAYNALLEVDNAEMMDVLYNMAQTNVSKKDQILGRYILMVKNYGGNAIQKYQGYRKALDLNPSSEVVKRNTLTYLSDCHNLPALLLAAKYMDSQDGKTSFKAASTVKNIIAKTESLMGGSTVKGILEKALGIFKAQTNNADAGYAVDEINGQLLPKFAADGYALANTTADADKIQLGNKKYENFAMILDYKANGDAVMNLRSMPQIFLGKESVAVNASKAKVASKANDWNTLSVQVINDRLDVECNGVSLISNFIMKNTPETQAILDNGLIEIIKKGAQVEVRDAYIHELPSTPIFTLSKEEEKAGFEVLFDGRNLDKWQGNMTDYVPLDGNIYVSARYGGKGNLYTKKKYSDFVYRFEFCFEEPGVNNGIGIRTNLGTDAAYDGMEIQVLDHDDPIYKGLHDYQMHGSVYGIIVPKHVKFDKVGTWYTEEIRAVGDNIKVTVNGDVILDGNIREACQGHNVAPDGGKVNPYTVDHKNHPGLFNKEGYVSFCGHGVGVKFRNVRILDLSKAKNKKKK